MVDKLHLLKGPFADKIIAISSQFAGMGHEAAIAKVMSEIMIYKQLIQQSTLCAFMNAYKIYAVLVLILIPLVFILKKFNPEDI